jgi:hypothetical protein
MNTVTSFGSTPALDDLRVPDGRRIGDLSHGEVYTVLGSLGIDGFNHNLGRTDAIAAYSRLLEKIAHTAGEAAIAQWMAEKRSV